QRGGLLAEAEVCYLRVYVPTDVFKPVSIPKAQKQRLVEREQLIHEIADKHNIKGFNITPLEREKVVDFLSKLADLKNKHRTELERLQAERQRAIKRDERKLESLLTIPSQLKTLQGDMDEKRTHLTNHKTNTSAAQYDTRLTELTNQAKGLEDQREILNQELRTLGLQSDVRAKFTLAKEDIKSKGADILSTLELANIKMRKLNQGKNATLDTLEQDVTRLAKDREQKSEDLEKLTNVANNKVSQAEAMINNAKAQLKSKKDELKALERQIKNEVDAESLEAAIKEAAREYGHRKQEHGHLSGGTTIYESLLNTGKQKRKCTACDRHLNDEEFVVFEKYMQDMMKKASPKAIADNKVELDDWEAELERLQNMRPVEAARQQLKTKEIPALEKNIRELEESYPDTTQEAEEALDKLDAVKKELKEIVILKEHVKTISRLRGEVARATDDVANFEIELQASGSVKTADDVQRELDNVTNGLRSLERDKSQITSERDRQKEKLRAIENGIHDMEMKEKDLMNEAKEKDKLEAGISEMQQEISNLTIRHKELDAKISGARAPIEKLDEERRKVQSDMNNTISEAQYAAQEFNSSTDKLATINKGVERYVKDRRDRQLEQCEQNIERNDAEIKNFTEEIEAIRTAIAAIEKEINASGASVANYRDNIRVRKLAKEIIATQAEIDSYDMEEAAKAKRNFEEKYPKAKEKENKLQADYSHLAGEVSSLQSQLKAQQGDLKEFKDINKKYTDQLIRMSDMANSDLEKYAKALDNAIMKYHGLKMEEVNDTMKHLWNKTYQGTDIDGIKIRSDVEGGASKRSYNYRVVMTKDQVEMDMRGRCSAGQKMLASIIIRLALSDSFGQNCGILALDEPTNALDTENIDALAASLVDIINERKTHSNFQLIIITHDENFLQKLGQASVMEYY
ncbi:hypothetical protein H0H93_006082, partial [Arthromyces matolae]